IELADRAINDDYLAAKFKSAESKLRRAVRTCGKKGCSRRVLARVYRDLGVVSIGGLGKLKQGRDAFARAVEADPDVRLEKDLTTPEIQRAFTEAGGQVGRARSRNTSRSSAQGRRNDQANRDDASAGSSP